MISSRLPKNLEPNAVARALASRRHGRPVIDLTASNPTSAGFAYPDELLQPLANPRALAYEPQALGLWSARAAVAADFRRRGIVISADRVALTSSTSEAYALLFKLLCDAGDAVLVPQPSYPLFEHLTQLECVTAVAYSLDYHGTWRVDIDSIRRAATSVPNGRVKAIMVVSPNNPTGSFLHRDDLTAISELAATHRWAIIGDEVFADYPLDAAPGAAAVLPGAEVLTFSLGGLSKSCGLPQLKLGWIGVGGPTALVDQALAAYEVIADTYLSVSTAVQAAAAELIEQGAAVRAQILQRVRRNLDALRAAVEAYPSVGVLRVEGGWTAVLQVPQLRSEESLVLELLEHDDVLVHPGYFFDFSREAFLVVSLLVEPAAFDRAIARVLKRAAS